MQRLAQKKSIVLSSNRIQSEECKSYVRIPTITGEYAYVYKIKHRDETVLFTGNAERVRTGEVALSKLRCPTASKHCSCYAVSTDVNILFSFCL